MTHLKNPLTYQEAGVSVTTGNDFVTRIKPIAEKTRRPGVLNGLGGFGALFEIPLDRYKQPILVSSTDGVGTKLKLAQALRKYDTIGIDLVAMCVNDIIVQGAEPLFFLDYFSTGHLELNMATAIVKGIGAGCEAAGAALVGGETAEMPGVYQPQDYDLAGFSVGIVEKNAIIDGQKVTPEDLIIGLASSGVHSNGFSLVRKILQLHEIELNTPFEQSTLGDTLLTPTRIYVKAILALIAKIEIHAIAHITGGGLIENIPRVLPPYTQAVLDSTSWSKPSIFDWIQEKGNISPTEMYRTFNNGIGMVLCLPAIHAEKALALLRDQGETAWIIGKIERSSQASPQVIIS